MSNRDLLKNLADKRAAHFKSLKKNRDHSHSIIGEQLYSKQSHFIFELLQNAEDETASIVKISIDNEKLIFEHNGRPFDIDDIEAITSFGNNERKKLKSNAIGRFGIGFKSVFSVTDRPEIKSGDFHFAVSNFIVPNLIDVEKSKTTIITLPFKNSLKSQSISKIEATLNTLDSTYLLFLNNVSIIEIRNLNNSESRFIKLRRSKYKDADFKLLSVTEGKNGKEFLLFDATVSIVKKKLPIKIAFTINRKANKIELEPVESSPLFAFFATEKESNLPFYIHAPFLTTPARDNIISDDDRNQKLLSALAELMVKAIEQLKTNNLIELKTWLVFPCNISFNKNEIYKIFCDSFSRYLTNTKTFILPSDNEGFCHVLSAMKIRNKGLKSLISPKESKLFFGRTEWVTQKINNADFQTINKWIEQKYKVPTVGFKELCEKADDSFFKHKSDEWLLKFYQSISESPELWRAGNRGIPVGSLRNKAFIRTSKNKTINPFDMNGNLNVYLPTGGTSDYPFVKNIFLIDKDARRLFKSLNITKPDLIAEVNEHVIPKIVKTENPYRGIKQDIQKIFRAIKRADDVDAEIIIDKLKSISWLLAKNNLTQKTTLNKPYEIYYPRRGLKSLLGKSPTAIFLDSSLFANTKDTQYIRSILKELGMYFNPRRFYKEEDDIIFEDWTTGTQSYWNGDNIELEGLKEYLSKTVDKKASINLWLILIKSSDGWKTSGFTNTKFMQQLKETQWLFNKFGQRKKPSEITPSEFDEGYEESNTLMDALEFKVDEIKNFEIEHGGKFLSNDELQKWEDETAGLKKEIERLKKQYEPIQEDDSEDKLPDINDIEIGDALSSEDTSTSEGATFEDHQISNDYDFGNKGPVGVIISSVPTKRQKKIGIRGEEFILKLLRESYKHNNSIEIVNLNEDDKLGVGCDIIIKRNGIAETLVEVKATEGGYENKFKISEKQWRTAIKSHLDTYEPEYHIYCVYYAGGMNPQYIIINDPIKWMMKKQLRFVEQWFSIRNIKK